STLPDIRAAVRRGRSEIPQGADQAALTGRALCIFAVVLARQDITAQSLGVRRRSRAQVRDRQTAMRVTRAAIVRCVHALARSQCHLVLQEIEILPPALPLHARSCTPIYNVASQRLPGA